MKKKWMIGLCIAMCALSGCGKSDGESSSKIQDDMTTEEAIKYTQGLYADNVGESDNGEELLENMIGDAADDFKGDGSKEKEQEEEINHDIAMFRDINYATYCEEELGIQSDVQTELSEDLSWYDLMCISNYDKTMDWTRAVEAYTETTGSYEKIFDLLKIEDCELDFNEIVNAEEDSVWNIVSNLYNSNRWEAVIDSGSYRYINEKNHIVSWDVDLSTPEKAESYITDRFTEDDTIASDDIRQIMLNYIYYAEDLGENIYRYAGLRLVVAKNRDGEIYLTMEAEPEEVSCNVNRMGEIAVYRKEQGWQWLWQKTAEVLHLQWDENGNRVRMSENDENKSASGEEDKVWSSGEFATIATEYGTYLFSVTSVKIVPSKNDENHEKLYQITWEYENIDFGEDSSSHMSLPDSALHIVDSDGYIVEHRTEFEDGEASNRDGVVLKSGEKCKAYSVFNINNEECEYLTIAIDTREGTTFKVYVEK